MALDVKWQGNIVAFRSIAMLMNYRNVLCLLYDKSAYLINDFYMTWISLLIQLDFTEYRFPPP